MHSVTNQAVAVAVGSVRNPGDDGTRRTTAPRLRSSVSPAVTAAVVAAVVVLAAALLAGGSVSIPTPSMSSPPPPAGSFTRCTSVRKGKPSALVLLLILRWR